MAAGGGAATNGYGMYIIFQDPSAAMKSPYVSIYPSNIHPPSPSSTRLNKDLAALSVCI